MRLCSLLRPERGARWDAAELELLRGLGPVGFRDAFWALHGYGEREPDLDLAQRAAATGRPPRGLEPVDVAACDYGHDWRDEVRLDHSALMAGLDGVSV
jgi:hypothetical protein